MGCGGSTAARADGATAEAAPEKGARPSSSSAEVRPSPGPSDLKTAAYAGAEEPRRSKVDYDRAQKSLDERLQEGAFSAGTQAQD